MIRTEVVDRTHQIHPVLQCWHPSCQGPAAACQRCQAFAERRVQALDIGGVDDTWALRALSECLNARPCAIHETAFNLDHAPLRIALHDRRKADMAPGAQAGTPQRSRLHRITERLPNGTNVGAQPISTEQHRVLQGTGAHPLDQTPNQRHVPRLADVASQPQAGADHHRQRHPHDSTLFLDADLVSLHLSKGPGLLDHLFLHRLALDARPPQPICYGPLIKPESDDDGLQWAAMRHQSDHAGHCLRRSPQTIKRGAFCGREGLPALGTDEPLLLTQVDADVALASLTSGRACQIGAEYSRGVHDSPPGLAWKRAKKSMNWLRVFQLCLTSCSMWRNLDSPVRINLLHMRPVHHEHHGQKSLHNADPRAIV